MIIEKIATFQFAQVTISLTPRFSEVYRQVYGYNRF